MVQSHPAETDPTDTIGPQLRALRLEAGLSLSDVAKRTDVSEATMSRIETGRSAVSAPHLYRLSALFGVDVARFFQSDPRPKFSGIRSIHRAGEGHIFETARLHSTVLCSDLQGKHMQPFANKVTATTLEEAGGLSAHQGEEYLYVQRGRLLIHSAAYATLLLEPGDSLYFDATMPHAYVAADAAGAEFLVVCSAPGPSDPKDSPNDQP